MQRVHFAKIAAEFAHSCNESTGQSRKGDVTFFKIHARFSESQEEVPACVRIDDGLKTQFAFVHLQSRDWILSYRDERWRHVRLANRSDKIPIMLISGFRIFDAA